ncbi:sushi domain-containing protein 2-like isoform X2 [Ruditapes philippinarum]|uniref:sushi domain-containing protein 2-like isoform X2 n=1 Tax=Ruditapes philippinarum TaxID=129788 RepID=UPI00295C26FF|nr:sushi domain-containing protein 2-like isoform X2 [Ruditapes philippinarum]
MSGFSNSKMAVNNGRHLSGVFMCFVFVFIQPMLGVSSPLYTFNSSYQDNEVKPSERNSHLVNLSVPIILEGKSYKQFFISKDGLVLFTTDKSAVTYHAQDWSAKNGSPFIDLPFITPYYHNGQALDSLQGYTGHVFYRIFDSKSTSDNMRDKQNNQELLNLGRYIREQVVGTTNFDPSWAIVITWENVTSTRIIEDGQCAGTVRNPCPTNTFQLVLITDGGQSFAIFNYGRLDMTPSKYSQAGFNGGRGTGFTNIIPKSRSIQNMNQIQGSDLVGRFIFRISSGKIFHGGCSNDLSYTQLTVNPNYAGMFGGKMIDLSGPCFTPNQNIFCRFEDPNHATTPSEERASYISRTRVRCVVPRLLVRDRVILSLSTDNGRTYPYSTTFTIVFPGRMPNSEHVTAVYKNNDLGWYSHNPTTLTLTWDNTLLSNYTNSRVDIRLIGYRETNGEGMYTPLTTLGKDVPAGRGTYVLDPQNYQCSGQDCYNYEVGLVEVRLQDDYTPNKHKFLSTKAIPLGWYVQNAMTAQHGAGWPSSLCLNWYHKAFQEMSWTKDLLSCPCSLAQAMADFGRWQHDHGCNVQNAEKVGNCFYHQEAVHCVRAVQPVNGAGNQCCYGKSGHLIFAADTFQGSTPDKSHDWGAAPYGKPGHVPSLSHWIDDVVTFYYCCLWDEYNSCDYYMDVRPTSDCTGYTPPVPASVYGQGHVASFGGQKFRMMGPGDYTLLKAGNTEVQARFQKNLFPTKKGYKVESTFSLTAIAIQDRGTSDRVELRLRGPETSHEYQHIDVLVNGQFIEFNEDSMKWQDFKGVAIVNTDPQKVKSNFTVLLTNGIGFQLAETFNTLQLDLMMPSNSYTNISGIMGDIDGTKTLPNRTVFDINPDNRNDLYYNYELKWAVNETSNLFSDILPARYSFQDKINLYPTEMSRLDRGYSSFCAMSKECIFDERFTGSEDIAGATKSAAERYASLSTNLLPVRSCGLLNVPRSKKSNYDYTIGTTTTITECRTGSFSGTSTYTCEETSNVTQAWSPEVTATCEVLTESADIGMIVGIVVAVAVVVIIAIVVAIIAVRKRKSKNSRSDGNDGNEMHKERPGNEYTI